MKKFLFDLFPLILFFVAYRLLVSFQFIRSYIVPFGVAEYSTISISLSDHFRFSNKLDSLNDL
jgi:intracellular septation protein A